MASQMENQNLYITTTTITTYDHYTGVVIIDTVWTGTWLGQQISQDVHHQVIHPESASALSSTPSTTPRPPPFIYLGPGELVSVARRDPPTNGVPESPVLSHQSGLAARVDAHRGNDNTSNTPRRTNRDGTATTTPNLTDYSRRRTCAILRRRHGSADIGDSSLLDGEIAELEGHAALRPSIAGGYSDSVDESRSAGQDEH